jgi:hypothetical protein
MTSDFECLFENAFLIQQDSKFFFLMYNVPT